MTQALEIGQTVWIHNGGAHNPLTEGKVVHTFKLPGWFMEHYVIEIPTSIDPLLEVRDWFSVSLTAKGPINMWKRHLDINHTTGPKFYPRTG